MDDYFQDDIKICIDFSGYIQLMEAQFGEGGANASPYYDARILYNHRKPETIDFIVYYNQAEYLFDKFEFLREQNIDILSLISAQPAQRRWDHPDKLDFSNSNLLDIQESHYWEHNKKPVILRLDNLEILKYDRISGDGRFQLTENSNQHIYEYINYGYLANWDPSDLFISRNDNKMIRFGDVDLILSFNHDYGKATKFKFEINHDSYLTLTEDADSLTDVQLTEYGNIICQLMSFYWQKTIDYFHATIRVIGNPYVKTREQFKYSQHPVDETMEYPLKDRYETIYDFIETLDHQKVFSCTGLLNMIVPRIIQAKKVDDVSEFMLLYNIIETIRNHCMTNPINGRTLTIKEEYEFVNGKGTTNKKIKNKIKEISEIVKDEDKEDFLSNAHNKVTFIRKTGLKDQFDSLVTYLGLDPTLYNLDFIKLISIRNDIYHGNSPREDVKPYNDKMRILIDDLILVLIQ